MIQRISRACFIGLFVLVFGSMASSSHAGTVDFVCSGTQGIIACTGTVDTSGSAYSTIGIRVYNTDGTYPAPPFPSFNLLFNTSTSTISLTQLTGGNDTLSGTITSFSVSPGQSTSTLVLNVVWNSPLPSAVANALGTSGGVGQSSIIRIDHSGRASSVNVTITPSPEPGTLALLGSGLLGLAGILRRRRKEGSSAL